MWAISFWLCNALITNGLAQKTERREPAEGQSQAFLDFQRDISEIKETFDSFSKDQEASTNADIERLKGDINKLELQIKQWVKTVIDLRPGYRWHLWW